jgi:hypothetical protein
MIPVDLRMANLLSENGGLYLRYSDDVLIVCPLNKRILIEEELRMAMGTAGLQLHDGPGKSTTATFTRDGSTVLTCDRQLPYLGFVFDGKHVRVRSQTIVRYMRRMRKAVRREKFLARAHGARDGDARVRRKLLYSDYTHLGPRNFISYAKKAGDILGNNRIREQIKRHWRALHASLEIE